MDRKWTALAALAASIWTFLYLAVPESELYCPGSAAYVWQAASPGPAPSPSALPTAVPLPATAAPSETPEPSLTPAAPEESPAASDGPEIRAFTDAGVSMRNFSGLEVDTDALAALPLPQRLGAEGPQILIIHTHGTEAYTPVPGEEYEASDPYRTTDPEHSVIRVGDVLCRVLEEQGLRVVHDRELYDYPRYAGSYARCQAAVESWLALYPGIGVVIDLHRDAVGTDKVIYKTLSRLSGDGAAQVMLVIGTGENGLPHPRWRDNLALALAMQRAAGEDGDALPRPIRLVRERYNQHLSSGAFILEVGTNGNTLSEAERAAEQFGRAVGPLFLSLAAER